MNATIRPVAVLICSLCLLVGCGSREQRTARLLNQRLQSQLTSDIAGNRAVLQPISDGARVTLLDSSLFPSTVDALDDRETDPRASVVEGMLDPSLMRVQITDTSSLPDYQRVTRVQNVAQYFVANGLGSAMQPSEPLSPPPVGSAPVTPAGLAITIKVVCPHRNDGSGYGSGKTKPACF